MLSTHRMVQPRILVVLSCVVATGMSIAATPAQAANTPPSGQSGQAANLAKKGKSTRYVAGKVQVAKGLRVTKAPVRVETLRGKRLKIHSRHKVRSSVGGGVFFSAKGLPKRFVVVVDGTGRKKSRGRGTLRAFVTPRTMHRVQVSFGTTVAVKVYRHSHGKWSITKSGNRTIKALKLPGYTELGFFDRVNSRYIGPKVLIKKSNGNLDKMSAKVARIARKGDKPLPLYKGEGPLGLRRSVGTLLHPRDAKKRAQGLLDDVTNVFNYGSTLWADVSAGQTGGQLKQITQQLTDLNNQMDALSSQVTDLQTSLNNGLAELTAQATTDTYYTMAQTFNENTAFNVSEVWGWFEQLQTTPCPSYNNCSAANAQYNPAQADGGPYGQLLADFSDTTATTSAPELVMVADKMGASIWDGQAGQDVQGLMTTGYDMLTENTAVGHNSLTTNVDFNPPLGPISFTGQTQPLLEQQLSLLTYWLSQLEAVQIFGENIQNNPDTFNEGMVANMQYLEYNVATSYSKLPSQLPAAMVYDPTIDAMWGNFGLTMLNNNDTDPPSPPAGMNINGSTVTFDSSYQGLPGSMVPNSVAQQYTWQLPQAEMDTQTTTPGWNSMQLGSSYGPGYMTQGLLTLFPNTITINMWEYAAALPVTTPSEPDGFAPFLVGLTGGNAYFGGEAVPLWVYDSSYQDELVGNPIYTVLEGSSLFVNVNNYPVGQMPTSTPNLLMYADVPSGTSFTWPGYIPNSTPPNSPQAPMAPQLVSGTSGPGGTAATVSWNPPISTGTEPISLFTATASPGGQTCTAVPPVSYCIMTGLTPGTSYSFTVTATNSVGSSPASAASSPVTVNTPAGIPGVPRNVTVKAGPQTAPNTATVSWSAPASTGSSAISSYQVVAYSNGSVVLPQCSSTATTTNCTVTNLKGQYTFSVFAVNSAGAGEMSAQTTVTTIPATG